MWLAVTCAVAGAFFLAFGAQRQGSAVQANTGGLALGGNGFLRLLRNPRWVLGLLLLTAGMALNVVALTLGTLTVIQPIGAIALVITTIVNAKDQNIRLNRATVVTISLCVTGSALFVLLAVNVVRENTHVTVAEELTVVLLLAVVVGLLGTCMVLFKHRLKAFFYILGAGALFGFVAVLTRIISKQLFDPNGLFLLNVQWYSIIAIAAAGGLGSWFVQSAYASGPPDLVIAGLTVIDPIVGIAIGIALLAIVGVVALSRHHPDVVKQRDASRKDHKKGSGKTAKR